MEFPNEVVVKKKGKLILIKCDKCLKEKILKEIITKKEIYKKNPKKIICDKNDLNKK